MKRILMLVFLGLNFGAFAQQHSTSDAVLKQLTELYNQDKYSELYHQLSPGFKQDFQEAKIVNFYQKNLKNRLGNIKEWKYQRSQGENNYYLVTFERGFQDLRLDITSDQHIEGMNWTPPKPQKAWKDITSIKSNNPKQTKIQLYIDSIALDFLKDPDNRSLSIGLVHGGKTETFFYGEVNKGTGILPNEQSVYEIGSISKTFTAIILAHAVNEGKISLNDDIRKYLPGKYPNLAFNGKPITIVNLANHTSRLPRLPANIGTQPGFKDEDPYKGYDKAMIYQYLSTFKPDTLPGTNQEYSNFAVGVLGMILENVYKIPLEKLLQQAVTGPLKMTSTRYAVLPEQEKLKTKGYRDGNEVPYWDMENFRAAGGLKSNLRDMLLYLKANMKDTNRDIALSHKETIHLGGYHCGLNWQIKPAKDHTVIWHDGQTAGFASFTAFSTDHKTGIIVLNNSYSLVDDMGWNLLTAIR